MNTTPHSERSARGGQADRVINFRVSLHMKNWWDLMPGNMKFIVAVSRPPVYWVLFIFAAVIVPGAEAAASWVVGYQTNGSPGYSYHAFVGRYDAWLQGNPRAVSYSTEAIHLQKNNLGEICSIGWSRFESYNLQPDNFDFNCIPSPEEVTSNSSNVGFYVGGLNANGVTIAQCYVVDEAWGGCDSDTSFYAALSCIRYVKCE